MSCYSMICLEDLHEKRHEMEGGTDRDADDDVGNGKPLVISISSNDNMGMNFRNLGMLYNAKNVYFVPFGQDDHHKKPCSLVAHVSLIPETIEAALHGRQLQPVLRSPF